MKVAKNSQRGDVPSSTELGIVPPKRSWRKIFCEKNATGKKPDKTVTPVTPEAEKRARIEYSSSTSRKQGQRGCCPFPLHPKSPPNLPPLRSGQSPLTIPNTSSTITMPASLHSDCCSPSLRNAVRLPSGINVHLHRNTQKIQCRR